jgi:hypothetical protein
MISSQLPRCKLQGTPILEHSGIHQLTLCPELRCYLLQKQTIAAHCVKDHLGMRPKHREHIVESLRPLLHSSRNNCEIGLGFIWQVTEVEGSAVIVIVVVIEPKQLLKVKVTIILVDTSVRAAVFNFLEPEYLPSWPGNQGELQWEHTRHTKFP